MLLRATRLTPTSGSGWSYSSYLGGSGNDSGNSLAVDMLGNAYVTGGTLSTNFPTSSPTQSSNAGGSDAFLAKIIDGVAPPVFTGISSDTGSSSTDRITTDQTLTISGTAPANATVKIYRPGVGEVGSVTANGSGAWSFDYTGTTLTERGHVFTATATVSGQTSAPTREYLVTVDNTGPAVAVTIPSTTTSLGPKVVVTASDAYGLANGTSVALDVDLNNDNDYADTGESGHTTTTLADGMAIVALTALAATGTYRVRARVTDKAGNEGTSTSKTFTVSSATSYAIATAAIRTSDPFAGQSLEQLGNIHLEHALDLDLTPGGTQAGNPRLVYNSSSVSAKPIVQATINTPNNAALPSTIGIDFTWNGTSQGSPVYYSTTGINAGDPITIAAQVNSAVTTTGRYPWSITVYIPGSSNLTSSGTTFVRAEDASPFGAGWTFSPMSSLFDIAADANGPAGKLWLYGTGGYRFFQGTTGTFTSPAEDNGTLLKNGDNTFTYTTPEQVKINFDTSGKQTSQVSADTKETLSFSYTSGLLSGVTAIDGSSSTFTYTSGLLSSISAPGSRTFTVTMTGTDLTKITDPDTREHGFQYTSHRLTRETKGDVQNQFRYASSGVADRVTRGTTSSPTITDLSAAAVFGLGALGKGTVEAVFTDALNHKDRWQLDSAGRALLHIAADGGTTTWTRDSAGRVSSVTDPIGRQTSYTRDSAGYVTVETLPDTNTKQYAYHATYHGVTSFTNERGHVTSYSYDSANGHLLTVSQSVTDVYATTATETTTYTYSSTTGLLDTITDPVSRTTTLVFDSNRRLWKSTDVFGTTETLYDTQGHVDSVKDPLLHVTSEDYDAMGRLTSRTDPLSYTESWTYNTSGLLQDFTDKNGNKTTYQFDSYGRGLTFVTFEADGSTVERDKVNRFDATGKVDAVRNAVGIWTYVTLDPLGRTTVVTDAAGGTKRMYFDLAGQLLESRDQLGAVTTNTYNSRGWITQTVDARGKTWTKTYDASGNRTQETDPLNHSTSYEYDQKHRARKITDPRANYTHTVWWGDGRVKETKDGRGFKTRSDYDLVNNKITIKEAYGTAKERTIEETLDDAQNVVSIKDGLNHTTSFTYNNRNEVTVKTDALTHTTSYDRDGAGNIILVTDALSKSTQYQFDGLGRQTVTIDAVGNKKIVKLDAMDRQVGVLYLPEFSEQNESSQGNTSAYNPIGQNTLILSAQGGVTRQEFDSKGQLVALTDPVGNTSYFIRNELGQVTKEIDPLNKSRTFVYDDAGRRTSMTDRLGRVREFSYFNNNLLQTELWKTGGTTNNTISYTYNENNQLLTAGDNNGTYTYTFDELSRVATQNDVWNITLTNTWDAGDRLTQVTDTKGGTRDYVYDDANRNTQRKFSATSQAARLDLVYNNRNDLTELKRYTDNAAATFTGNTLYVYDDARRLTSITHKDSSAATIDSFSYTLDFQHRVTGETSTLGPSRTYTYDETSQLLGDGTDTWTYDLNGNRTLTGYQTGTGNRLSTDGTWNYSYDDEGNLTQKEKISTTERWNYTYNHLNQMTKAEHKATSGGSVDLRVEFKYDVLGNRIEKSVDSDGDGSGTATVTRFAYEDPSPSGRGDRGEGSGPREADLMNAWADLNTSGTLLTRRLYLPAVDAVFARFASSNNEDWYLTDRLGSVRDIVNSSGSLIDHIDYESYGAVSYESQSSNGDRYKFTGRELDSETGLQYNRARYYQFDIGRWTDEDPLRFGAGDSNLYRYISNTPANGVDPSGLDDDGPPAPTPRRRFPFLLPDFVPDPTFPSIPREGPNPTGSGPGAGELRRDLGEIGILVIGGTVGRALTIGRVVSGTTSPEPVAPIVPGRPSGPGNTGPPGSRPFPPNWLNRQEWRRVEMEIQQMYRDGGGVTEFDFRPRDW